MSVAFGPMQKNTLVLLLEDREPGEWTYFVSPALLPKLVACSLQGCFWRGVRVGEHLMRLFPYPWCNGRACRLAKDSFPVSAHQTPFRRPYRRQWELWILLDTSQ